MRPLQFLLLSFIWLSCGNSSPQMEDSYAVPDISMREMNATIDEDLVPGQKTSPAELTKKLIKTGRINFQSESIAQDYVKIKSLLAKYDSYIDSENETNNDYQANYDITIRVSSTSYDSLYAQISKISDKVDYKSSNIEDVTARYYDLKTRIKNKKILEERYLALLKKASSIKDILEIERSLNEVRNKIESAEGGYRYLSKQVSYSTIQIIFYELLPSNYTKEGFGSRIMHAFKRGRDGFLSFFVGAIQTWPFIILIIGGVFLIKTVRKKRRQQKK